MQELLEKYNIPAPRYTSYPPVPYWDDDVFTEKQWIRSLQAGFAQFGKNEGVSLYIHLPYCESMCTFCGCNKRITKNHGVEGPYIKALIREWELYLERLPVTPVIADLHLGGGTPTFFSPENLKLLVSSILKRSKIADNARFSFEGHPRNTTKEHLQTLFDLGFRRVSYGIQDFDPEVQVAINRIQTYEQVEEVTTEARKIGFDSVNYDVVYGLPFQQMSSVIGTMEKISILRPDRIAFYSYAHVPWIKGLGQRKFTESDLPSSQKKHALYLKGRELLMEDGYEDIAMDHFALPHDDLSKAFKSGKLNRNFMGYTELNNRSTIGLGVSSISDSGLSMAQNVKDVESYLQMIDKDSIPVFKGHILSEEDLLVQKVIHDLMCKLEAEVGSDFPEHDVIMNRLAEPLSDDLIEIKKSGIKITKKGKVFLRNVCMTFDLRLWAHQPETRIFSMAV